MSVTGVALFSGWLPIQISLTSTGPRIDWAFFGERRLTEPFFEQSVERTLANPANLLFRHQSDMETLRVLYTNRPGLKPSGFIFHMSRCGSTLISQMLAALPQNVVISEAAAIDTVLQSTLRSPTVDAETRSSWLRWVVSALGQPRSGKEEHYFIKFDSWHTLYLPLILQAFPDVPWIFLYREPVEVVVSSLRQRSARIVPRMPEAGVFGLDPRQVLAMEPEEYCSLVVGSYCRMALRYHSQGRLLNYVQLPEILFTLLPGHFRVQYKPNELEMMRHAARLDAKTGATFVSDSVSKQAEATDLVRSAVERWARPAFNNLERLRAEFEGRPI